MSAKIAKITNLEEMSGYDTLELATVFNWKVAVKKGEHKIGDLVIYFGIGSILPLSDETKFLYVGNNNGRLKTRKFRDYISQGLVGPLSWLPSHNNLVEETDVTELMRVTKYIPEEEKVVYEAGTTRGKWPNGFPKTDEERAQYCLKHLRKHMNSNIIITKKYDGTSTTFAYQNNIFKVLSRNNHLLEETKENSLYFEMARKYNIEEGMKLLGRNIAIQGETVGPKINGNRMKMKNNDFFVFNIYDIDAGQYLYDVTQICNQLGLKTVDIIYHGPIIEEKHLNMEWLLDFADQQTYDSGAICEGIVIKTDSGPRFSCKVISNKYILKYNL